MRWREGLGSTTGGYITWIVIGSSGAFFFCYNWILKCDQTANRLIGRERDTKTDRKTDRWMARTFTYQMNNASFTLAACKTEIKYGYLKSISIQYPFHARQKFMCLVGQLVARRPLTNAGRVRFPAGVTVA